MPRVSPKGSLKGTSVYKIGKTIQRSVDGRVNKNSPSIVEGLKPKKRILSEGYHVLSPDELAGLLIPTQEVSDGKIHGFQREAKKPHIRKASKAIAEGTIMPVAEIGIYQNSNWIVDGQQRAFAAIIAGESLAVVARKMSAGQMHDLFANQQKQLRINPSLLVLSANDEFSEYVQDAATSSDHVWTNLVSSGISSSTKMNAKQAFDSIVMYVGDALGAHVARNIGHYTFNREKADELGKLFSAFGTKKTNPVAYRPIAIKAITYSAILIIRRNGSTAKDIDRWINHMPKFPFNEYMAITRSKDLSVMMIRHWNKRLQANSRIPLPEELV
jgi:hypothetical protein